MASCQPRTVVTTTVRCARIIGGPLHRPRRAVSVGHAWREVRVPPGRTIISGPGDRSRPTGFSPQEDCKVADGWEEEDETEDEWNAGQECFLFLFPCRSPLP